MQLVFFLEEASAKALLQELLPRLIPGTIDLHFVVFQGKQDMEKRLPRKLRGWQRRDCHLIVLRDKDAGDCRQIKTRLQDLSRTGGHPETLIRIACRELESWYLGDLSAVENALDAKKASSQQNTKKFRNPDALDNPVQELTRLAPSYQKISGSRAMGQTMSRKGNTSHSFNVFLDGIERVLKLKSLNFDSLVDFEFPKKREPV